MSDRTPRIEQFFERAAGIASGGTLHPALVLSEVVAAAEASVRDGMVANAYEISLAPEDAQAFAANLDEIHASVLASLNEFASGRGLRLSAPWLVEFEARNGTKAGSVAVAASFRNRTPRGSEVVHGETQVIRRLRGASLTVEGVGKYRVTHAPFVIGRGKECDLPVLDLAMSRRHAVIEISAEGEPVLEDLGSRNGIRVEGERLAALLLTHGVRFVLGSTTFVFEQAP